MLAMSGGMAAFGTAASWVWTSVIAKALQYLGIMGGVGAGQRLNSLGSLINSKTGRIITPAYKMGLQGVWFKTMERKEQRSTQS